LVTTFFHHSYTYSLLFELLIVTLGNKSKSFYPNLKIKNMKIGVTGATGQLGQLVVASLKNKISADNIVALVRTPEKAAHLGVEARAFDYNNEDLSNSLNGIDTLMLISGSEVGQREAQHKNVIDAAQKAGVKRIVYTSLLKADKTQLNLGAEHMATENMLLSSGINYTILRNGWYTENYTGNLAASVQAGALIGCAGNGQIASASRQDYADAAAVVLTSEGHDNKTYELAGDEAYTLSKLAQIVSTQTGKNIPYINMPASEYAVALEKVGLTKMVADMLAHFDSCAAQNDLYFDQKTLSQLIGRPTTSIEDMVKATLK